MAEKIPYIPGDTQPTQPGPLANLAENKLLWQYLSAAGQDIGAGKPLGANVNAVTQQNIASQNYAKLLKKWLEGGAKMTADKDNVSFKVPTGAFQAAGGPGAATPMAAPQEQIGLRDEAGSAGVPNTINQVSPTPAPAASPSTANSSSLNTDMLTKLLMGGALGNTGPSASPLGELSGSDLAGLTPQDISQALQFKFGQEKMQQGAMGDAISNALGIQKIRLAEKELNETSEQKLTADVKNYQYAVSQGYKGTFADFKNSTDTAGIKEYEYAKAQGYTGSYQQWKTDLAKAGGTNINIGEKVEVAEAMADVKARKYFTSPEGLAQDIDKYIDSEEVQNKLIKHFGDKKALERETVRAKEQFISNKIRASGGTIIDAKLDGRDFVWKVKWSDGRVTEVRYGN